MKVVPPFRCNSYSLILVLLRLGCEARLVRVSDQICNIVRMHSVENSVEVRSVWKAVFWIVVLHVLHDFWVRFELGKDVVHTKFVELRNVDEPALADFEKLLLAFEHFAKEVSVCCRRWRYVVLHYKVGLDLRTQTLTMVAKIREQVLLGAELVSEFAWDKGCSVASTHRTAVRLELHFGVFHHCCELCWNLKMDKLKLLLKRFYSA